MKFRKTQPITKSQFLKILNEGESSAIAHAIIDAVNHIFDYEWLVDQVRYLLERGEEEVVPCALLALADMARQEKDATRIEMLELLSIVERDERFVDYVEIAKSDIDMFLPEQTRH